MHPKTLLHTLSVLLLLSAIMSLYGCGSKKNDTVTEYDEQYEIDDYETDYFSYFNEPEKVSFTGDDCAELDGRISSISSSDTASIIATTTDGSLFYLFPDYYPDGPEMKSYKIADKCMTDDLIYADQHIAYVQNHLVYFEGYGEYVLPDDIPDSSDSFPTPEYVYSIENVKEINLADDQNLLYVADKSNYYAYLGTDSHIYVAYKDSSSEKHTTYSDVTFINNETERTDLTASKSIYRFLLTDDQELFYIDRGGVLISLSSQQGATIDYLDCTAKIDGKVADFYNLLNSDGSCYVVDEENNIYYVSASWHEVEVSLITTFDQGKITDIQGFSGRNENILIKTDDGSYYYNDYNGINKIDTIDQDCKSVLLLMNETILTLGNDGCLYIIEI